MLIKKSTKKYEEMIIWAGVDGILIVGEGVYIYPDLKHVSCFKDVLRVYEKLKTHFKTDNYPRLFINDKKMKIDIEVLHIVDKEFTYKDYTETFQSALVDAMLYYYDTYIHKDI